MAQGVIISIVNQKGGVGKTTTSINLAAFLGINGHKTLLIDFDPQANATSGVGLAPEKIKKTVYDALMRPADVSEALYPSAFENLHVMPACADLSGAEVELVQMVSRETILNQRIAALRNYYDFILIDCPPSLGLLTINALVASSHTIVPVQCEYFALEGLSNLLNTLHLIKEHYHPLLQIAGIVLTMHDKRTSFSRQVVENAKSFFNDLLFETIVPRNVRLSEAPSHGLPIALYNPLSKGSQAYLQLTQEVIKRVR